MWNTGVKEDSLSLCSHYLRMKFEETNTLLATGTGFIYEYNDQYFLITNGHNLTGVNPETNKKLSQHGGFPTIITTKARIIVESDKKRMGSFDFTIDLYDDDDFIKPRWLIHPKHGYNVDVIALPIEFKKNINEEIKLFPINRFEFDKSFIPEVSDDVFILGFPLDINGGKDLPIWKKGTIATEVGIDIDGLPKILIDTATRSGMSGSPVIYRRTGYHKSPTNNIKDDIFGTIRDFLGIYSGRIGAEDNFKSQLGIVWKKNVIQEILEGNVNGTIEFQKL